MSTAVAFAAGAFCGALLGYIGGRVDEAESRLAETPDDDPRGEQ